MQYIYLFSSHPEVRFGFDKRALLFLPLYHVYGMININMAYLFCGFSVVILPKFEPHSFLSAIEKYKVRSTVFKFYRMSCAPKK